MEKVAVLVPVYNEEDTIEYFFKEFSKVLKKEYKFSFVVVNDGSTDNTEEVVINLKKKMGYPVKLVSLPRNVGQHAAILFGIENIDNSVDFVIISDVDLQNPPNLSVEMINFLKRGNFEIVYGIRPSVKMGNGFLSFLFWTLLCTFSSMEIPGNQTPLKVFNNSFLRKIKSLDNKVSFVPIVLASVRARVGFFPVPTVPRRLGSSKYNLLSKIRLFLKALYYVFLLRVIQRRKE